jgi:hypothetical protein
MQAHPVTQGKESQPITNGSQFPKGNQIMSETQATAEVTAPAQIIPNFDNTVDIRDFKFSFRKDDLGNKRPTIELKLPCPSVEGLVRILETGGKQLDLLLSAAQDVIVGQARMILNDNETMTLSQFPTEQCTWEFIANMPEATRAGRGIAKEVWDAFSKDYIECMPAATGKTLEAVSLAAKLFLNKFQSVKSNKPVLTKLKEQLAIYANTSTNAESFGDCIKFLDEKATELLEDDGTKLLNVL